MTNLMPRFNSTVHGRLTELMWSAEEEVLRRGFCAPDDVERYLFGRYISAIDANLSGCGQYLLTEEQCAAESFIIDLCAFVGKSTAGTWKMAAQLMCQPTYHFPNYHEMLTTVYVRTLRKIEDVRALRSNGVVLLAAASLPGWEYDARRELRRRGFRFDPTLVSDELSAQRVRAVKGLPPVGKVRKRKLKKPGDDSTKPRR